MKKKDFYLIGLVSLFSILILSCAKVDVFKSSFKYVYEGNELNPEVLEDLDSQELRILRNLVYAKHGYSFQSDELQHYFYAPGASPFGITFKEIPGFQESLLSTTDIQNVEFILHAEENGNIDPEDLEIVRNGHTVDTVDGEIQLVAQNSFRKYHQIIAEDVIGYFDLESQYVTDLQKKTFLVSEEYSALHSKLLDLKIEMLTGRYRLEIGKFVRLSDYDVDLGGFFMKLPLEFHPNSYSRFSSPEMLWEMSFQEMNAISGFYTGDTIHGWNTGQPQIYVDEPFGISVFLECSESDGLRIEKLRGQMEMYLDFEMLDNGLYFFNVFLGEGFVNEYPVIATRSANYRFYTDGELVFEKQIPDVY